MASGTAKALKYSKMEIFMMVSILKAKHKEKEFINGKMAKSTADIGEKDLEKEKVIIP